MNIIQKLVLLDQLKGNNEIRRTVLAKAREEDPVVAAMYRLLDPTSVDLPEPLARMSDALAARIELWNSRAQRAAIWAQEIAGATRRGHLSPGMPALREWEPTLLDDLSTAHESELPVAAKGERREEPPLPLPKPPYICVRNEVLHIRRLEEEVPFALARLLALRDGRPVQTTPVLLTFNKTDSTWDLELALADIHDGNLADGKIFYHLVPATKAFASWFSLVEVQALFSRLSPSHEKECLKPFLDLLRVKLGGTDSE